MATFSDMTCGYPGPPCQRRVKSSDPPSASNGHAPFGIACSDLDEDEGIFPEMLQHRAWTLQPRPPSEAQNYSPQYQGWVKSTEVPLSHKEHLPPAIAYPDSDEAESSFPPMRQQRASTLQPTPPSERRNDGTSSTGLHTHRRFQRRSTPEEVQHKNNEVVPQAVARCKTDESYSCSNSLGHFRSMLIQQRAFTLQPNSPTEELASNTQLWRNPRMKSDEAPRAVTFSDVVDGPFQQPRALTLQPGTQTGVHSGHILSSPYHHPPLQKRLGSTPEHPTNKGLVPQRNPRIKSDEATWSVTFSDLLDPPMLQPRAWTQQPRPPKGSQTTHFPSSELCFTHSSTESSSASTIPVWLKARRRKAAVNDFTDEGLKITSDISLEASEASKPRESTSGRRRQLLSAALLEGEAQDHKSMGRTMLDIGSFVAFAEDDLDDYLDCSVLSDSEQCDAEYNEPLTESFEDGACPPIDSQFLFKDADTTAKCDEVVTKKACTATTKRSRLATALIEGQAQGIKSVGRTCHNIGTQMAHLSDTAAFEDYSSSSDSASSDD